MDKIQLSILTPERVVYEGESDAVYSVMHDGERGFLPGHASMVGLLGIGKMRAFHGKNVQSFEVEGGFVEFNKNRLLVLAEEAMRDEELSEKEVRLELEKLEEDLSAAVGIEKEKLKIKKKKLVSRLNVAMK